MLKTKVRYLFTVSFCFFLLLNSVFCQDTNAIYQYLTLDSVVIADVRNGFDVNAFIRLVQNDTSFYQAFRNLHSTGYTCSSRIAMYDKKGSTKATYEGRATQILQNNCRHMQFAQEKNTGDFYDAGEINYYTARMFAYIFLYRDTICSGNSNAQPPPSYDKKLESRKDALKTIMFDPGKPVDGVPFIKNKTAVFDFDIMRHYDFFITEEERAGEPCYVFSFQLNENSKPKDVVVQQMKTWFNKKNFQIVARTYDLQYDAGVYDFNVQMDVRLGMKNGIYLPAYIYYTGTWNVPGKPRESGTVQVYIN